MWESKVDIYNVFELRCKTTCYFGVGAINKVGDIFDTLKNQGIDNVIFVTDKVAYKVTGAWDVIKPELEKRGIKYVIYEDVSPNPTTTQINEATKLALENGAKAVIGIGGGSPIDAAKSVAVLLEYTDKTAEELYEGKFVPTKAKPIIAINTTHGTGTEVDRFAVASILEKEYKPAIAYDCIYPTFAIDDPQLMKTLPKNQTIFTAIDAINHVTEAATTLAASPYSILLAKETIRLISRYLPQAVAHPDDLTARYYLLYASAIAGISFDNGLLHFTHALEHPLSAVKPDLAHGLGLAILLPAVVKQIYVAKPEVLADIYNPIVPGLKGIPGEAEKIAVGIEKWLFSLGVTEKLENLGFVEKDIPKLTKLALETPSLGLLLSMAPIKADEKAISSIYRDSLTYISR
ncbi:alcohol dehydrogenase [Thermosipho melanesiensis]|uniref:Iron-containing alcohol dehydrogenase n=2 Tax=Thermosipho melanesiensis TaxID=46541 RepID=A6LJB5_THEM4|nr:iron-containing alcohol dehydrogenase [Thermosipho melanesiensis]ABR30016.1 iron-containing alcohol dehydrogenase [Thermosipho melanesiensis BI429]APT73220.1 alcohol dehydrogenase [Thermosipho melanesiensis]OOC38611.1 alcohol dehydrogenase [Thermosipho melanesiensis]OOC40415.1 alcohol dehydrogenase [Thermosipho melanesiensis]OOC40680.1 alcohol dehydrogenase [Thermosipho melanesiensis]